MSYGIELPIGAELKINGNSCIVTESKKCSSCAIQKMTEKRVDSYGASLQCGTNKNKNISEFLCHKDDRTDGKNIIFKIVS